MTAIDIFFSSIGASGAFLGFILTDNDDRWICVICGLAAVAIAFLGT